MPDRSCAHRQTGNKRPYLTFELNRQPCDRAKRHHISVGSSPLISRS